MNSLKKIHFDKFNKLENDLKNELISKENILERNEFQNKVKKLQEEIKSYRINRNTSNEEINNNKIKNTKKILLFLDPIIKKYVDNNSIALVLPKKNIIVGKKNLDITDAIINILNEQVKEINFE